MLKNKIYLSPPIVSENVNKHVLSAMQSGWISSAGTYLDKFENQLKIYTKAKYIHALNSGTSALHLAMKALDIKEGDHVIVPCFSFVASVMPLKYLKAIPVFIDADESGNMSVDKLEEYLSNMKIKPKAAVIVHSYGIAARIWELKNKLDKYNIPIIEDAAEALGTFVDNQHVGLIGDIGVLSFNGNKIITTSAGGVIMTHNKKYYTQIKKWAQQSKVEGYEHYYHDEVGYNYRMSNICAAIGFGQLEMLKPILERKKEIYLLYKKYLGHKFNFLNDLPNENTNHWLTVLNLKNEALKINIYKELKKNHIESRYVWFPLSKMPIFENNLNKPTEKSNDLFKNCLALPSGYNIQNLEIKEISGLILDNCYLK